MVKYDKNSIYNVNVEGIEQGLFIGISNIHYDEVRKYCDYLIVLDQIKKMDNRKEMTQEDIEKELGYKIKIVE